MSKSVSLSHSQSKHVQSSDHGLYVITNIAEHVSDGEIVAVCLLFPSFMCSMCECLMNKHLGSTKELE